MKSLLLAVALTMVATPALADDQVDGIGIPYASTYRDITTTAACIATSTAASTCAVFPAGNSFAHIQKVLVATANGAGTCCFVGKTGLDLTLTAVSDASGPNGSGFGACWRNVIAAQESHVRGEWETLVARSTPGIRSGLCSSTVTHLGDSVYAPCGVDADCSSYGGGTCRTTPTEAQKQAAGLFITCESDTGTVRFTVRKERVRK